MDKTKKDVFKEKENAIKNFRKKIEELKGIAPEQTKLVERLDLLLREFVCIAELGLIKEMKEAINKE